MKDFKKKLLGALALLLLFSEGLKSFSGTKRAALRALMIPLAMLPITMWFSLQYPPKGMEVGYSSQLILGYVAARTVIAFIFATVAVAAVAHFLKCREKFWLYLEAVCWLSLATAIVMVPFAAAAANDVFPREEMDRILALASMYLYVVKACVIWKAFNTYWQIAGATSILTLFMNQETSHLLYVIMGVPIPW